MLLRQTRCLAKVWGVRHRHSWFCRHSNAIIILGHQEIHCKYESSTIETKIETEPRIWKVGKKVFGSVQRECSWLVHYQQIYQQRWTSHHQRLGTISLSGIHKGFLSVCSHFYSILDDDQMKCNTYTSFKQLSVLWYCLMNKMFSEDDSSFEEKDIYVKLFLSACNAFSTAVNKSNKGEKDCSKKWTKCFLFINNKLFQST